MKYEFREMREADLDRVLEIRNEATVRENSLITDVLTRETHYRWFRDVHAYRYVFLVEDEIAGAVILKPIETRYEWSFYVSHEFTGQGMASVMLSMAMSEFARTLPKNTLLEGKVRIDNGASKKIHWKFGFVPQTTGYFNNIQFITYSRVINYVESTKQSESYVTA